MSDSDYLIATTPRSPGTKGRLLTRSSPASPTRSLSSVVTEPVVFKDLNFASLIVQPGEATHICFYVNKHGMASVIVSPLNG
jgi:hypothetical protein